MGLGLGVVHLRVSQLHAVPRTSYNSALADRVRVGACDPVLRLIRVFRWRAYQRPTAVSHASFGRIEPSASSGRGRKRIPFAVKRGPAQWHGSRRPAILSDPVAQEMLYFDSAPQAAVYVAMQSDAFTLARNAGQVVGGRWSVEDASAAQVLAATRTPAQSAQDAGAHTRVRPDPCPSCTRQFETEQELARHESNLLLYCPQYGGAVSPEMEARVVAASDAAARMLAAEDETDDLREETVAKGVGASPAVLYDPVTKSNLKFTTGSEATAFLNMPLGTFSDARNSGELAAGNGIMSKFKRWQILDENNFPHSPPHGHTRAAVPGVEITEQPELTLGTPISVVFKRVAPTNHRVTSKNRRSETRPFVLFDPLANERHQFSSEAAAAAFLRVPENVFAERRKSAAKWTGRWLIEDVERRWADIEPGTAMDTGFPSMDRSIGGHYGNPLATSVGSHSSGPYAAGPPHAPHEGHAAAPYIDVRTGPASPAHAPQKGYACEPHIHHYGGPHRHPSRRRRRSASATNAPRQGKRASQVARGARFAPMLDGITMKLVDQPPAYQPQVRMCRVIVRRQTAQILRSISSEVGLDGFISKALRVDLGNKLLFLRQVEDEPVTPHDGSKAGVL